MLFHFGLVYVMKQKLTFILINEKQTIVKKKKKKKKTLLYWQHRNKVLSAQLGRMNLLPVYHQMVLSFSALAYANTKQ